MLCLFSSATFIMTTNSSSPGGALPEVSIICRNFTHHSNGSKMAVPKGSGDFGAVMYIIVVLTFYSLGIIIMIVKYLKTERKEMEEEMVLDSFFKGIPDKRIEHEKEAVNRVAIRAFHTLTTSRSQPLDNQGLPRCGDLENGFRGGNLPMSGRANRNSVLTSNKGSNLPDNQRVGPLSPPQYRRERYSIQPTYIETVGKRHHSDDSDTDDDNDSDNNVTNGGYGRGAHGGDDNDIDIQGAYGGDVLSHVLKDSYNTTNEIGLLDKSCKEVTSSDKKKSRPNKSVIFSDNVDTAKSCDVSADDSDRDNFQEPATPRIKFSCDKSKDDISVSAGNTRSQRLNAAKSKQTAEEIILDCKPSSALKSSVETSPGKPLLPKKRKDPGKSILAMRRRQTEIPSSPLDSPKLGLSGNSIRMSSIEKGMGDGSSYDSSSSLLTRIHLADSSTPPLAMKRSQNQNTNPKEINPGNVHHPLQSNIPDDTGPVSVCNPSRDETDDEKMKLTSGDVSMQPCYDSTSSSVGFTTRVNVLDKEGRNGSKKACLVTDL